MNSMPIIPSPQLIEPREGAHTIPMRKVGKLPRAWRRSAIQTAIRNAAKKGKVTRDATTKAAATQDAATKAAAKKDATAKGKITAGSINAVRFTIDADLRAEHYTLTIATDGITLTAGSADAVAHALKTLYQYIIAATEAAEEGAEGEGAADAERKGAADAAARNVSRNAAAWTAKYNIDRPRQAARQVRPKPKQAPEREQGRESHPQKPKRERSHHPKPERARGRGRGRGRLCSIPNVYIEDYPAISVRGFMLDISRDRVPRMRELRTLIGVLGLLKYNQLQLYVEHTFAYRRHRTVWKKASPLRARQIRHLDSIAHEQGIELMPNQNYLGHMERWLKHKKYRHLAECPDGFTDPWNVFRPEPSTRNVTDPRTQALIQDLATQYAPLFRSNRMHIGYDEPWEFAQGASKAAAKRIGIDTLFHNAIRGVHDICAQLGKKSYIWADIVLKYPQKVRALPNDIGLCLWGYEADHPFEKEIQTVCADQSEKRNIMLCCGTSNWNSVTGRLRNAEQNIAAAVDLCATHSLEGAALTEWGDNGHFQQHPFLFLPILLFAQYSWHRTPKEHGELTRWMDRYLFQDTRHSTAKILHALATAAERHQFNLVNASVLHCMLLGDTYPYYRPTYPQFKNHHYDAFLTEMDELHDSISALPRSLVKRELLWSADILSLAARCIEQLSQMKRPSLANIPRQTADKLGRQLARCVTRYRTLWRKRSRPGGLSDSAERLTRTLQELRSPRPAGNP